MSIFAQRTPETIWRYVLTIFLISAGTIVFIWFKNPSVRVSSSSDTFDRDRVQKNLRVSAGLLPESLWKPLKLHGQIPINVGSKGRATPFRAVESTLATPGGRDARRVSDLITIASALAAYYDDTGRYPVNSALPLDGIGATCLTNDGWVGENICLKAKVKYLDHALRDPSNRSYVYTGSSNHYTLDISFETIPGLSGPWRYSTGPSTP